MTVGVVPDSPVRVGPLDHLLARTAVGVARVLAKRSPERICAILTRVRAGSRPATYAQAKRARDTVLTVSVRCCGKNACLPRSLAAVLLCRVRGVWPEWCAGVVAAPPFAGHAWIEAEGHMVDEFLDETTYKKLCRVPPAGGA
ncbi:MULTISPECIES: lasso peptide biosynthesis B2 protein [Streptomyces]|uniref:Lasso peptide biosynthesis B2 protein n=1 Tax=Streptomyces lycii TaxID=2654337 RepID=A0ABQ7FIR9_9ACTN|nr:MULTISPECIES: lasso peptide biosynthesis B2 protein [Streptomyces]KAF4408866.1 lasso peptide biosynthesis B2 protein [Streptomyces lycii]PGH52008.1 polyketide beta-ketoacyl synthase [Streptomyces sp. Ru87]